MKECEECGKKLGIFEGYGHPTMGRKHLVCGVCFDRVEDSVAAWREFILTNPVKDPYNKTPLRTPVPVKVPLHTLIGSLFEKW